jgi:hypothetical protein
MLNVLTLWKQLGPIVETFDPRAREFPVGFMHDISLVDVSNTPPSLVSSMKSPLPTEWLSEQGWQDIKYETTNLFLLSQSPTSSSGRKTQVKSIGILGSQCQVSDSTAFNCRY